MYFLSKWSWLWSLKNGQVSTQSRPNSWISFSPIIVGWSTRRMVDTVDSHVFSRRFAPDIRTSGHRSQRPCGEQPLAGGGLYRWSQRSRCALDSGREVVMTGWYATKVVETPSMDVRNKKRLGVFHEIVSHLDSGTFRTFVSLSVLETYKTDPLVLD